MLTEKKRGGIFFRGGCWNIQLKYFLILMLQLSPKYTNKKFLDIFSWRQGNFSQLWRDLPCWSSKVLGTACLIATRQVIPWKHCGLWFFLSLNFHFLSRFGGVLSHWICSEKKITSPFARELTFTSPFPPCLLSIAVFLLVWHFFADVICRNKGSELPRQITQAALFVML